MIYHSELEDYSKVQILLFIYIYNTYYETNNIKVYIIHLI